MKRPEFLEGQTVMVCRHIFEDARAGKLSIDWASAGVHSYPTPRVFTRDDNTTGVYHHSVFCSSCKLLDRAAVDCIEEVWVHDSLHVADFMRGRARF